MRGKECPPKILKNSPKRKKDITDLLEKSTKNARYILRHSCHGNRSSVRIYRYLESLMSGHITRRA